MFTETEGWIPHGYTLYMLIIFKTYIYIIMYYTICHIENVQVVEIHPQGRQGIIYPTVKTMAADDPAPCVARASAAMALTQSIQKKSKPHTIRVNEQ